MGRVALDLNGFRTELQGVMSRGLGAAALQAKKDMGDVARRMAGGDMVLSGVGKRGKRIGAGFDYVKGSKGLAVAIYANGPWQLVEYGRRAGYRIPKRRGTGPNRDRGRRDAPRLHLRGGGWVTGPLTGGRVGGRHGWNAAQPAVMDGMGDEIAKGLVKAIEAW